MENNKNNKDLPLKIELSSMYGTISGDSFIWITPNIEEQNNCDESIID